MTEVSLYKLVELFTCIFLAYVICFKFVFGEYPLILYGSVFVALLFMIIDIIVYEKNLLEICPYGVALNLIMCVYSLITGLYGAKHVGALLNATKTYFSFSLVCILICYISKEEHNIEWLANFLIIINIISAFFIIIRGYYISGYGYVLGPDNNPNTLALHMDIGLFCVAYKIRSGYKQVAKYLMITFLFIFIIINSGSRKCLIAAIIICTLWVIPFLFELWRTSNINMRVAICFFTVITVFSIIYYYNHLYITTYSYNRMQHLKTFEEVSSIHRLLYYKYALDYFSQRPLFGIGLAQFTFWNPFQQYSHSTYAEAIADWGVIGSILYFAPVFISGNRIIRMILDDSKNFLPKVIFALWAMEIFLGTGQIWFYGIGHLLTWTLIYLLIDMNYRHEIVPRVELKYVKNQNSNKSVKNTKPNGFTYFK